jgi:hypothetical protein
MEDVSMEINSCAEWCTALQQHMLQGQLQNRMAFQMVGPCECRWPALVKAEVGMSTSKAAYGWMQSLCRRASSV